MPSAFPRFFAYRCVQRRFIIHVHQKITGKLLKVAGAGPGQSHQKRLARLFFELRPQANGGISKEKLCFFGRLFFWPWPRQDMVPSWYPAGTSWHQLGTSWYQLVPAGTSWVPAGTQLVSAGTQLVPARTQLVPAGTSCYQLVPAGTSWDPLIPAGTS